MCLLHCSWLSHLYIYWFSRSERIQFYSFCKLHCYVLASLLMALSSLHLLIFKIFFSYEASECSEVVSIQLLSVSETCNDFLWYLWFSSFSVSVGLKVFRSLHWFTEASLLIILEMLFLFSSCLLRKLPPTSCDSYGSLIPHDLEILVVDDLILSNLMFKT